MPISYQESASCFHLTDQSHFSLVLRLFSQEDGSTGVLTAHYGAPVQNADLSYLRDESFTGASFDTVNATIPYTYPTAGHGDFRPIALSVRGKDGTITTCLQYESYRIVPGKPKLPGLPSTYCEEGDPTETLELILRDPLTGLKVTLLYSVFENLHALTSSVSIRNEGNSPVQLEEMASACLSLRGQDWDILHLHGAWGKERQVERVPLMHGTQSVESHRGASGHQHNPFMALMGKTADEFQGEVYGVNLVYSGSFRICADADAFGMTRMVAGLTDCRWRLAPGESFQTPEAVLVYSREGLNGMSHIYHKLYRTRLVRGVWRDQPRPILINNWEGTYFNFNEEKLLAIASKAAEIGVELFVLDDGWFGRRNSDTNSLGDWTPNLEKLPGGIIQLANKINDMGLKFGLWYEPEMISPDSDLYRAHPDWCLHVPNRYRTLARHQLILDLSRRDVQDYILSFLSEMLSQAKISYIKWDMNRNFAQFGSAVLPPENQAEVPHRYMLGLYRVLEEITAAFPQVLFECCSGGGGRFDPGMLHYMPQTWTSDDSDAVERLSIQYGTSIVYPASAMGAHVSDIPNHQVNRSTPIQMRGDVAMSGNFGYELDLSKQTPETLSVMREQVRTVKELRSILQRGTFSRLLSPFDGPLAAWQFLSEDEKTLVLCMFRKYARPNDARHFIRPVGLQPGTTYICSNGQAYDGSVLMHVGLQIPFTGPGDSRSYPDSASCILVFHRQD